MAGHGEIRGARRGGFTLLELLLTLVILMALLGATVFSFSSLQRRAALDEGVERLQTLFRFARAHAAASGRVVEVALVVDVAAIAGSPEPALPSDIPADPAATGVGAGAGAVIGIRWEPEPALRPGVFVPLPMVLPGVGEMEDLVAVRELTVQPAGSAPAPTPADGDPSGAGPALPDPLAPLPGAVGPDPAAADPSGFGSGPVRIRFYPDGASDSARVTLVSRDPEDLRTAVVELVGITGLTRVSWSSGLPGAPVGETSPGLEPAGAVPVGEAAAP